MRCLSSTVELTRSCQGMTLNLYLDQHEDIYMRVYKIYFDRRFDRGVSAKNKVNVFKNQVWYSVYNKIRSPKDCAVVTDKLLHYLKLISAFPVTNIEESDAMATIQLDLISHIGYITAGVTEVYEGPISPEDLQVDATVYIGREQSVIDSLGPLTDVTCLGEEVTVKSVDLNARTAVVALESAEGEEPQTFTIAIDHLRKPIDQTTASELKFAWNPEFVDMLKEYFVNENPDVRLKAFNIPTLYNSKSEWSALHSDVSSKIKMKQQKKKKKKEAAV